MSLQPGTRLGPYQIVAPIGAGGMGEVYRASDTRLDRAVAIKVLPAHVVDNAARRQRFQREARAVSQLSHANICALYDVGDQDGVHFIVMEYLAGETLADRLKSGALPIEDALRYAIEIADALDHAHRQGIIHRDLKPANIMLTRSGAKLLDFGVARFRRPDSDVTRTLAAKPTDTLTEDGVVLGTLQYMAPEQLEGKEADARTDIFALGAVIYEMVAGRRPFDAPSTAGLIAAILNATPAPLVSPLLEHVISRCLMKDPEARWQTAADVRQELKWIAGGAAGLQNGAAGLQTGGTKGRRRRVWPALAGAVAVAGAIYVARFVQWRQPEPALPSFKQLTFRRGNISQARFAPDKQTILYSAAWDGGPMQIYQTRSNLPTSSPFGQPGTGLASISSQNEVAVILNCELDGGSCTGTLATMSLTGGAPRPVLDDVVDADWDPDGKELAVIHLAGGESRVEYPPGKTRYTSAGKLMAISFSPKGDRIAFVEHPVLSEEYGDIKIVDLKGGDTTLLKGWKTMRQVRWSPAGDEIWFTGSRTAKNGSLHGVSLDGVQRMVLQAPGDLTMCDVAADGRVLLTHMVTRGRMIWASGETQKEQTQKELSWLDWSSVADLSPDGKTVFFHEWGEGVDASPVVYSRDVSGANAVKLGDGKGLARSPDGRWVLGLLETPAPQLVLLPTGAGERRLLPVKDVADVFWAKWVDTHRILVAGTLTDGVTKSFIYDIDTTVSTPIGDPGSIAVIASPNGKHVVVMDPLGQYFLWPVDGGDPIDLDGLGPEDRPIRYSPEGTMLYIRVEDPRVLRIDRYVIATKRREKWREVAPRDPAGIIGVATERGEVAITPDGLNLAFTYWVSLDQLFLVEHVVR